MLDAPPVQAPAPPRLRDARGLVFFRLRRIELPGGRVVEGQLQTKLAHNAAAPPPYGAEAWRVGDGAWSEDLDGHWRDAGEGRLEWKWR